MNSCKNVFVTSGFVLAVSLIAAAVSAWLVSYHYSRYSFDLLNTVCCEVIEREPETQKIIAAVLKEYTEGNSDDFSDVSYKRIAFFAAAGALTGLSLFFCTFLYRNRAEDRRIRDLAEYLEQVNSGKALILSASGEDDFSKLADEIYKTVTSLYQTRELAARDLYT